MARISHFEERPIDGTRLHQPVICGFRWFDAEGERILQLDTYGSADRAIPGKVSQTMQLDRRSAKELKRLLGLAFPDL